IRREPNRPAMEPSQVFFGEICGARGCLPKERPAKYATVSAAQVITRANRSRRGPSTGRACRRLAKDSGNATSRRADEDTPAEGRDSTRGRRVNRVRTVRPRTNRKNTVAVNTRVANHGTVSSSEQKMVQRR